MSTTYRIPQKTSPEDKIIGPFTIRDIVFLLIAGLLCYLVFAIIPINPIIEFTLEEILLIIGIIGFISIILIMVKPEERGLELWIIDFMDYIKAPKIRFWRKEEGILDFSAIPTEKEPQEAEIKTPTASKQTLSDKKKIDQLSSLLDNPEQALLNKKHNEALDFLVDDEDIERAKRLINEENEEIATNQQDNNLNKERKQQSQELLKFLDDSKSPANGTIRSTEILAKPDTGIKGFFSSFSRGVSSIFSKSTKKQDSAAVKISTKESIKKQEPSKLEETAQAETQKAETPKIESIPTIDPSTSPEKLFSELKNLKQRAQQKIVEQDNSATQQKPIKIISEADPLE